MPNNDFYVSFGSDASTFGAKLQRDLAPARAVIASLRADLASIGSTKEEQAGLGKLAHATRGGGTGGTGETGRASLDLAPVQKSISAFTQKLETSGSEINGAVDHLLEGIQKFNAVLTGLESQTRLMGKVADRFKEEDAHRNRSRAAQDRIQNSNRNVGGTGLVDDKGRPIGGRFAASGAPASMPKADWDRLLASMGRAAQPSFRDSSGRPADVTISNTPRVLVDEAAFQRVVDVVEQNVRATEEVSDTVRSSVSEIIQALNRGEKGVGGTPPKTDGEKDDPAVQREKREEIAESRKSRAEARAERQAQSRLNARIQRQDPANRLTPRERVNLQALLDVPANREQFRDQSSRRGTDLTRARLEEIATAFRSAGYVVPNAKTRAGLSENILKARSAYEAAGGTSLLNLNVSERQASRIQPDSVPRKIWDILGGQDGKFQQVVTDDMVKWAKNARSDALKQGIDFGPDELASPTSRKQHRFSSGAELAGTRESSVGGMYPSTLSGELLKAQEWLRIHSQVNLPGAALERASRLRNTRGSLNIYDSALDQQIEGSGPKAKQAREMLLHLRQAMTALDTVAPDAGSAQRQAQRAEKLQRDQERSLAAREAFMQREALPNAARDMALRARTGMRATRNNANITRLFPGVGVGERGSRLVNFGDFPTDKFEKLTGAFNSWISSTRKLSGTSSTEGPDALLDAQKKEAAAWQRVINTYERTSGLQLETSTRTVGGEKFRDYSPTAQHAQVVKDLTAARRAARAPRSQATSEGTKPPTTPPPTTPKSRTSGAGGENGILRQILAAINSLHSTIKTGVKITGATGPAKESVSGDSRIAATVNRAVDKAASSSRTTREFGTEARRKEYLNSLDETTRRLVTATNRARDTRGKFISGPDASVEGQRLAGATSMVKGGLSQTNAAHLVSTLHNLTAEQTADFQAKLSTRLQDAGLNIAAQRAKQRAIRDAELAAGQEARYTEVTRTSILVQNELADTMNRVSSSSASQVEILRALSAAGASDTEIAAQRVAVYRALDQELASQGLAGPARKNRIRNVISDAEGTKIPTDSLNSVARAASADDTVSRRGKAIGASVGSNMGMSAQSAFERTFFGNHGFWSRILNSTGTFVVRNFSAALVFGLTAALRGAIETGIQTESTFIRVSDALEQTGRSADGLRTGLGELAEEYGVALKDVYETAAGLTGLFDQSDVGNVELLSLTRIATQLQLISGGALNATEAMRALASVTSAFAEVSNEHVADVATAIQNELGVNIEETIEGVARLSGQAKQLGFSFEGAATYVAAIAKFTNMTGAGAGEQFSRILASLQTARTQQIVVQALGQEGGPVRDMFNTGDYEGVIQTLLRSYGDLNEAEKNRIATALGGQRQAAAVNGLLIKGAKVLETVASAQHSQNVASDRAKEISDQLASEIDRVGVAFERFFQILVRSGALGIAQVGLEAILKILGLINWTMDSLNDLFESNTITRAIRDWGLTLLGVVAGFKLLQRAYAGFKAASVVTGGFIRAAASRALPEAAAQGAASTVSNVAEGGILAALLGRRRGRFDERMGPAPYVMAPMVLAGTPGLLSRRRFDLDEQGAPVGRLGQFYARRSISLQERGVRLAGTADRLRTAATASVDAAAGGKLIASERALNAARRTGAATATAASRAMSGLSSGMAFYSRHAIAATAATSALVAGIGFAINAFISASQAMDEFNDAFDKAFGPESELKNQTEQAKLAGTFQTAADKEQGEDQSFWSGRWFQDLFSGNGSFISRIAPAATNTPLGFGVPESALGQLSAQGINSSTWQASSNQGVKLATDVFRQLGQAGAGQVTEINTAANEAIEDELNKIRNSTDMSAWEKNDLVAFYSDLKSRISESADRVIATAHGLDAVLTSDQLAELPQLINQIRSTRSGLRSDFGVSTFLAQLASSQGFTGKVQEEISRLAGVRPPAVPGTGVPAFTPPTVMQQLEASRDILRAQLPVAIEKWQNAEASGANPDDVDRAKQAALGILNGLGDVLQEIRDAQTQAIQDSLTHAERIGNTDAQKELADKLIAQYKKDLEDQIISPGEYQNRVDQVHDQLANALNAQNEHFAAMLQASGANRLAIADAQLQAAQNQLRLARLYQGTSAINAALEAQAQANAAWRDALNQSIQTDQELAIARIAPGDTEAAARQAAANAQDALNRYIQERTGGVQDSWDRGRDVTQDDAYKQLEKEAIDKQNALQRQIFDGINTRADSMVSLAQASGDGVRAAQAQLDADLKKLEQARELSGGTYTPEVQAAEARVRADQLAVSQANGEVIDSSASLSAAIAESAGDAVGAAQIKLANLQDQLSRARSRAGGVNTAEVINLQSQIAQQQAALRDAQSAILDSYANLAIATAEAAGNTVEATRLRLQQAQATLSRVEAASGGLNTQSVIDARTQVAQANAAMRDAQFQDQMDAVDFSMQMEQITSNQAIKLLQAMLSAGDLTEKQRRDVMLKIHGLQDDIRNTLTGSGFNIPDQIKLPTPYEVRRSLGVQAYQGVVKDSISQMRNITAGIGPIGQNNAGNTAIYNQLLSAIKGMSSGTSVNQDIQITNQVQTPAMVETIAKRVVQLIDTKTKQATRANTPTPSLAQG